LIMLGEALNELSVEELRSAISGMDLDRELTAEKLKPILTRTMSAGGIAAVAQLLGKNVIKKVIMAIVEKYILKKTGEKVKYQGGLKLHLKDMTESNHGVFGPLYSISLQNQ